MHSSTDLTVYRACEVIDSDGKPTGTYKLTRRSLEPGMPYLVSCDHAHATAKEALACEHFSEKKISNHMSALLTLA